MKQNRGQNDLIRAACLVREGESRVAAQKERIADLKSQGLPSAEAESTLVGFQQALREMRNHLALLREMMGLPPGRG